MPDVKEQPQPQEQDIPALERLKLYLGYAETTRKWVTALDTKAGFVSALNAALLGFVWASAKLPDSTMVPVRNLGVAATFASVASLMIALWAVLPRVHLKAAYGKKVTYQGGYGPVSFFGYVAGRYPAGKGGVFRSDVDALSVKQLATEALEQHHTVSLIAAKKTTGVAWSGILLLLAIALTLVALLVKEFR
jgi:hypothetical protein